MKNDLVVKDNALINASYNLEVTEQRLILLSIIRARETGQGISSDSKLEIHASDYASRFDVTKEAAYNALKNAVNNLFERKFSFKEIHKDTNKEIVVKSRWVSRIAYVDDLATLEVTFAPDVVPLITRLEKHFTSYQLKQVAQLTSKYAIRLYEFLIAWRDVGKTPVISLSEFREKLGLDINEYQKMVNFKSRVLEPAIKQINELTDIHVKYEQYKTGRSISGLSFTFKHKKIDSIPSERDPNTVDLFTQMTDAQRHMFANKLSELPEMGRYSQGTESYPQFAIRIAEMLKNPDRIKELYPYLKKVGYMPSSKKDVANG
ncbi:replication initiation protein RepM [Acinetobacter johnsonii]|jgi:plasmid replication initiation protein|uniref:RepB family plasmid replication initiator protein n=1 Tax=Acinetobacter johnsonii TaxID=40214 RepID=A0A3S9AQK4_ACIJO|nr:MULTISPECIES: replication initiation protein RepM [Acinetobacter]HRN43188.1 replication initiation protein RepM [Flavobacterium sp.]AZN65874.1 RepB family plasmid replication initiator protein [Acinetobacter johnsonii]MDH1408770.1 replication initiation protein RepM [Acinetobacter johnsonii]MDV2488365.1 replication initiation protein RepM [Acinetobacter johnsonii]MEB6481485.1 replication initiation protein RepM [Acinetobacter vivianii]